VNPPRTWSNPPSTNFQRPKERKFYVWQDRHLNYGAAAARRRGWEQHPWRWLCTLCDPPTGGMRVQKGAWERIMTVSMPCHFRVRRYHHAHVAGRHVR
jgi:hypothetical protein